MKKGTVIIGIEDLVELKNEVEMLSQKALFALPNTTLEEQIEKLSAEKDALEEKLDSREDGVELNRLREENRLLNVYIDELRQKLNAKIGDSDINRFNEMVEEKNKLVIEVENLKQKLNEQEVYIRECANTNDNLSRENKRLWDEKRQIENNLNSLKQSFVNDSPKLYSKTDIMILPMHFLNNMNRKEFTVKNFTEFLEGFLK